jgi:hypothetical protein
MSSGIQGRVVNDARVRLDGRSVCGVAGSGGCGRGIGRIESSLAGCGFSGFTTKSTSLLFAKPFFLVDASLLNLPLTFNPTEQRR